MSDLYLIFPSFALGFALATAISMTMNDKNFWDSQKIIWDYREMVRGYRELLRKYKGDFEDKCE